jgi:hypothetical protein
MGFINFAPIVLLLLVILVLHTSKITDITILGIIIIDYLRPASFGSADTYCYDTDIRKFLLSLNH